ncbi:MULTISPECIES: hypothetical protein [Agrobacterium]|uniref:Uncharacterized protein n=1 Tax=Agrobacterium larrymoorei TaxID=160699 RepID=A0ABX8TC70_9HYPH|nr:hypothetical protein [Agrobacterium larrymoorei]NSZ10041.1 hypothetical protein [Agrobacterium tumefaciens]QYA10843.1 hypothetical protein J5285_25800 [Agrobacterium larrymoorei]
MKKSLCALALIAVSSTSAFAQFPVTEGNGGKLVDGQKTVLQLIEEGYEIKGAAGPLLILQKDKSLFGCSAYTIGPGDMSRAEISANRIPCSAIK